MDVSRENILKKFSSAGKDILQLCHQVLSSACGCLLDSLKCHQIESKRSKIQKFPGGACHQTPLDGALTVLCGHKSKPYLLPEYVKNSWLYTPLHNAITLATFERANSVLKCLPSPTIKNPEIHLRDIIAPPFSKSWIRLC